MINVEIGEGDEKQHERINRERNSMKRIGPTIQLSTEAARRLIDDINRGAANVRSLLLQLHDGEGWRALGYKRPGTTALNRNSRLAAGAQISRSPPRPLNVACRRWAGTTVPTSYFLNATPANSPWFLKTNSSKSTGAPWRPRPTALLPSTSVAPSLQWVSGAAQASSTMKMEARRCAGFRVRALIRRRLN